MHIHTCINVTDHMHTHTCINVCVYIYICTHMFADTAVRCSLLQCAVAECCSVLQCIVYVYTHMFADAAVPLRAQVQPIYMYILHVCTNMYM